jgi:hypothetical protein
MVHEAPKLMEGDEIEAHVAGELAFNIARDQTYLPGCVY